jgi:hypothetical protein
MRGGSVSEDLAHQDHGLRPEFAKSSLADYFSYPSIFLGLTIGKGRYRWKQYVSL